MRTGTLVALCGAAMLALVSVSQASPMSASGTANIAIQNAMAEEGITQVRHRRHHRHYGWYRGRHYGWRHRHHHHRAYGYAPRRGVSIYVR
jgi:hypothetical protein